jgi:alpha-L-fucosidase
MHTYYNAQLEELASHYGDLVEFWLDGAGSAGRTYNFAKIIETLRTYQPNTIVFADTGLFEYGDARWAGDESGKIEYQNWNVIDRHGYLRWRPVEVDTPLRKLHWFWHPHDEASLKSVDDLMDSYENAAGTAGSGCLAWLPMIAGSCRTQMLRACANWGLRCIAGTRTTGEGTSADGCECFAGA